MNHHEKNNPDKLIIGFVIVLVVVIIALIVVLNPSSSGVWRDSAPTKGDKKASIKMVEFGDYQCLSCKEIHPIIENLLINNTTELQFQYRHFPLSEHKNSYAAAISSEIAHKSDHFWEMHNLLFKNQDAWSNSENSHDIFKNLGVLSGVEPLHFDKSSQTYIEAKKIVNQDAKKAKELKLMGTPSLFFNNKLYEGELSQTALQQHIDSMR